MDEALGVDRVRAFQKLEDQREVERWAGCVAFGGGTGAVASLCLFWFLGFGDWSVFLLREIDTIVWDLGGEGDR